MSFGLLAEELNFSNDNGIYYRDVTLWMEYKFSYDSNIFKY